MAALPLAKLRNSDLNSFLTSNTDLNVFCPFQHRGKLGSDTCFSDLVRAPLSCLVSMSFSWHFFQFMEIRMCHMVEIYRRNNSMVWLGSKIGIGSSV
jgi:hypothetical protein